ncbi:MAG TPA: alpha/beta fold hydrolase [Xanthobacteraceae bacterium]|jgi:dienelactone hydrolase|nr:alpha/beta fold hydrolase [Xanthobacteraceae bacterium]
MFEYFDDNYTWNMAVNLALGMGASIGDIDDASRALRPLSRNRDDAAAEKFFESWTALAVKLRRQAAADEARGRRLSAGAKYRRAFIAFIQAERMQRPDFAAREQAYRDALDCFSRFLSLTRQNCRRVEVPYLDTSLPALLIMPREPSGDRPCMVHFDGLDVTKEIIYLVGVPGALAERGVATLVVDNPGVGESLRLRKLHNGPDAEAPAKACVDFLQTIPGIDRERIGIMALSLGGYHAPRAAAFEQRFKCCVAWGANYDWGETQRRRYESKDQRLPVPHYWDHVGWVFGKSSVEDIVAVSEMLSLRGILHQIKCPILCIHGENDRQISLSQAKQLIAECTASPKAELHVQTLAEGGAEHCGVDNVVPTRETICDWIAEALGGNPAGFASESR